MNKKKIGVILLNMGGPEKNEDVEPFLFNLFSDREIIKLGPPFLQKVIAWYISKKRAPKSAKTYALIGGGSPITKITLQQQDALQKSLDQDGDFIVQTAMRYWHPRADVALSNLIKYGVEQIIAIPLYPHYSCATTGSSFKDLQLAAKQQNIPIEIKEVNHWPQQRLYIDCLTNNIISATKQFKNGPVQIVYSAHSLPVSFIDSGDPYVKHLKLTIKAIEKKTGLEGKICFQSRSGPVEWLSPSTPDMLQKLAAEGCKRIVMVPISFVSDHVETLYEIDILYKNQAKELGMRLVSTEALNTNPKFIDCLKQLVVDNIN